MAVRDKSDCILQIVAKGDYGCLKRAVISHYNQNLVFAGYKGIQGLEAAVRLV